MPPVMEGAPTAPRSARTDAGALSAANGRRTLVDISAALLAVAAVGTLDAQAPADLDSTALYLGIIALVAWRTFLPIAVAVTLVAWAAEFVVDLASAPSNLTSVVVWNGGAGLVVDLGVAVLAWKVRREREMLRKAATHDVLTGLPNRVLLQDRLEQALLAASREALSVGLLVFDLDGFKRVNDTMGHHAGDQVLRLVAIRVRAAIRTADTCARLGGDEFAVVLPRTTMAGVRRVTDVVRNACAQPFVIDGRDASVSASLGAALSPADGSSSDALLRVADGRMYEAKAQRSSVTSSVVETRR